MKLLEVVDRVVTLTDGAPYAIVGGLAQMLWARKAHTDDLDVAVATHTLAQARARVLTGKAGPEWSLPRPPDLATERNEVFEVDHLLYEGVVVDLLAFASEAFSDEILKTATAIAELRGVRFIVPELLLVTQLLRPGTRGALAAVDLIVGRAEHGGIDEGVARRWALEVQREPQLDRALSLAAAISASS